MCSILYQILYKLFPKLSFFLLVNISFTLNVVVLQSIITFSEKCHHTFGPDTAHICSTSYSERWSERIVTSLGNILWPRLQNKRLKKRKKLCGNLAKDTYIINQNINVHAWLYVCVHRYVCVFIYMHLHIHIFLLNLTSNSPDFWP